jgi:hypothetical protein
MPQALCSLFHTRTSAAVPRARSRPRYFPKGGYTSIHAPGGSKRISTADYVKSLGGAGGGGNGSSGGSQPGAASEGAQYGRK